MSRPQREERQMSIRMNLSAALLAGLVLLPACARKKESLPPPPPPAAAPATPETMPTTVPPPPPVSTTTVPGSAADFVAKAGTDTVLFGLDSYGLDETALLVLDRQAEWLNRFSSVRITIEGHCDERGTREYNLALGERRANAVKNFLAARGVSPARMTVISYGKERPAVDGSTEEAWAQNRRAVTVLISGLAG
jgi:peptidoglycan-associated lipoprotein